MTIYPYEVLGRTRPTKNNPIPKIFKAKIYAANEVVAKSRFAKYLRAKPGCKAKKANLQILSVKKKQEPFANKARTFGFLLNYQSRTHRISMYKEVRATTETDAVNKLYADMAGKHRAKSSSIQITECRVVSREKLRRPINKILFDGAAKGVKYVPIRYPYGVVPIDKTLRSRFVAKSSILTRTRNLRYFGKDTLFSTENFEE